MTGAEFKAACSTAEDLMLTACFDDARGNMTISFIGVPREWSVFVAVNDGRDLTGTGETLFAAFVDLVEQYKAR